MTKFYTNAVVLMMIAVTASVLFSAFIGNSVENEGLMKASFIFGTALAGGLLSVAITFAGKAKINNPEHKWANPVDANVLIAVTGALVTLASLIIFVQVEVFTDMVAEGIAGSIAGSVVGVITAFAKKDGD